MSTLVTSSDKNGHPASLVEVLVSVALAIFVTILRFSFHDDDDEQSATVELRKGKRLFIVQDRGAPTDKTPIPQMTCAEEW